MTTADIPMLAVQDLVRRFGPTPALNGVSLSLGAGQILCLAGPSGCGKSTLLRLIAGVDVPDAGTITLAGRVLAGPGAFVEPDQRGVGFMFQDYALFPHLTVAENVAFGLTGLGRADKAERVASSLDRIGLGAMADRHPHSLSGGEQQRVALARALAPRPALMLMDEPFSNLDRSLRARLRDETMAHLRELGTAAIIVTHDSEEALSSGDRLAVMRAGRIVEQGTARKLYLRPGSAFVADMLGPCAHLPGVATETGIDSPLGLLPLPPGWAAGRRARVIVRPEAMALTPENSLNMGATVDVESISFLGAHDAVRVRVPGVDRAIVVHAAPGLAQPGTRMRLTLDPRRATVLPDGGEKTD